ncbi:hypothetical protein Tco_0572387 [Tanacetum coccineum]
MCRALGRIPTVGTFRRLYVNSISNGWLSFSKRGGVDDPCYYSKKFDSLKNWNNCFFWIDASVCLLSTSWFSGTSVVKDPLPVDEAVDLPCVELLNENRTLIRKYPETCLCLVGLSHSFTKTDVRLTLLYDNDDEMGLLDFVNYADPFKVKTGERTLAKNEVPLLTQTEDRVISPSLQTISLIDHTIQDELNVKTDKRKKRVAFSEQVDIGSGSVVPATEDATSCSVTPTLERALEYALHDNARTRLPSSRFAGASVPITEPVSDSRPLTAPEPEIGALSATPSQGSFADDFYES